MADRNSSKVLFRPPKPLQSKDFPDDVEQKLRASLGRFSVAKPYLTGNVLGISKEVFLRQPDNYLTVPKLPKEDKPAITSHPVQAQTVADKKPKTPEPKKESPKPKVQNPPSGFDFLESLLRSPGATKEDKKHGSDVTVKPEKVSGASDISDDESNHSSDSLNWLLNISLSDDDEDTTITEENIKQNPAKQVPSKNVKEIMHEMIWPRNKSFACVSPIGATPTRKEETVRPVVKTEMKVETPVEAKQVVSRKRKLTDSSTSSCDITVAHNKEIRVKTPVEPIAPRQRKQTDSSTSSCDIKAEMKAKTPVRTKQVVSRQRKQTDSSTSSSDIKTEMNVKTLLETKPVVAPRKRKLTESSNSSCDITEVKTANSRRISRVPTKDTPKPEVKTTSVKEKLISQNYSYGAKPLLIKPPKQSTLENTFPMLGSKNHIAPKKPTADVSKHKLIERKPLPPSRQTVQKKPVPKINDELANFFCRKSTMDQIQRSKKRKLDESEASPPIDEKEDEVAPIIQVPVSQTIGFVFAQPNLSSSSEDESTAQQKIKFSKKSLDRRNTSDYDSSSKRTSSERSESENDRPEAEVMKPVVRPILSSSSRESSKSKQLTSDYETSSQSSRSEDSDSSQKKVSTVKKAPQPLTNEKNHQLPKSLFTPDTICHVSAKHDSKDQQKSHQEKSTTLSRSSSLEDSDSSQKKVSTVKKAPPSSINEKTPRVSKPLFAPDTTTLNQSARKDSKDQRKSEGSNSRQKKTSTGQLSESLFTPDTISQNSTRHDSKDHRKSLGEAKRDTIDKVKHEERNSKDKHRSKDKQRDKSSCHARDSKDSKKSKDKHHDRTRSSDSRRDKETRTNSNTSLNEASLKCSIPFSKLTHVDPAWLQKQKKTDTEETRDIQEQIQTVPSLEPQFRSNVPRIQPDPNEIEQACSNLSSLMNF